MTTGSPKERLDKDTLGKLIQESRFKDIFIKYLQWDRAPGSPIPLHVDDEEYIVNIAAQKRGFAICVCDLGERFSMPMWKRKLLSRRLSQVHYEHLLIAVGKQSQWQSQRWSVMIRPQNRPVKLVEVVWHENQDIQKLLNKLDGLIFTVSDEDSLSIVDVIDRAHSAFATNAEKVTRRFYDDFKKKLSAFAAFIEGIQKQVSRDWYAALMLNRLMFIYFIQKKGFLNGEDDYLQNRLRESRERWGKDRFHSHFYRHFLRRLFHEGLDMPMEKRTAEINELLGKVPYLNGGLFDTHPIEQESEIDIPDKAFEDLFVFFDKYNWYLDDRMDSSGSDINPDVIGYIFEKYINDRAAMGAYYTQEDITGYIARSTIIPFLLRRAQEKCASAFAPEGAIWRLLREEPDHYIYPALQHGCQLPDEQLPDYIREGLGTAAPDLLHRRRRWNEAADPQLALPTETWREVIARRERYSDLRAKIAAGELRNIDDLITYNLDIQRFTEDALSNIGNADFVDFIQAFFTALAGRGRAFGEEGNVADMPGLSALDPACGSGAFLFAALRVLEPLYERCVERISGFVAQDDRRLQNDRKGRPKYPFFRAVLRKIDEHPNQRYWIYKTIILNNLFGVDIMSEAAEIAKLRLFLKLAAEAEYDSGKDNLGLEPLPDIDYNIRAGNSLVGYASMADFKEKAKHESDGQMKIEISPDLLKEIGDSAREIAKVDERFRQSQDQSHESYIKAKRALEERLQSLNDRLDRYLAGNYGQAGSQKEFAAWKAGHKPFHWLSEFYDIIENNGGFDVIIGNPPYVRISKIKYLLPSDARKLQCPDIYGYFLSHAYTLTSSANSRIGLVVMHNLAFHNQFQELRKFIKSKTGSAWFSFYGRIPSGLFSGNSDVRVRNCIFIAERIKNRGSFYTTRLHRWNTRFRDMLFLRMGYTRFNHEDVIPMFNDRVEAGVLKIDNDKPMERYLVKQSPHQLFFKQSAYNWISVSPCPPPCFDGNGTPTPQTKVSRLVLSSAETARLLFLLFNGRLFFTHWLIYGDEFDLTVDNLFTVRLPIGKICKEDMDNLLRLADEMEDRLESVLQFKLNAGKRVGSYNTSKLWHITDESDIIFLKYLTDQPEIAFESIMRHVSQTITTGREE